MELVCVPIRKEIKEFRNPKWKPVCLLFDPASCSSPPHKPSFHFSSPFASHPLHTFNTCPLHPSRLSIFIFYPYPLTLVRVCINTNTRLQLTAYKPSTTEARETPRSRDFSALTCFNKLEEIMLARLLSREVGISSILAEPQS